MENQSQKPQKSPFYHLSGNKSSAGDNFVTHLLQTVQQVHLRVHRHHGVVGDDDNDDDVDDDEDDEDDHDYDQDHNDNDEDVGLWFVGDDDDDEENHPREIMMMTMKAIVTMQMKR